MLTKLSNNRIDLLQCVIVPASHAFKKEVAMNAGSNRILLARLGENIIVTSSPGERNVHRLQGLDLSNGQHRSHNYALNNCHDSVTNHKEKYPNINIVDQFLGSTISVTTSPRPDPISSQNFYFPPVYLEPKSASLH